MIELHDISGKQFYLNCDLIYRIDNDNYDTIITMTNMQKLIVEESTDEVVDRIISYRRKIHINWREELQ